MVFICASTRGICVGLNYEGENAEQVCVIQIGGPTLLNWKLLVVK